MQFPLAFLISTGMLLAIAAIVGRYVSIGGRISVFGILIDERDRMSLNRFQVATWTILVISTFFAMLLVAFMNGQLTGETASVMKTIATLTNLPTTLLGLMGISAASATMSGAVKDSKNLSRNAFLMGSPTMFGASLPVPTTTYAPRWMQMIFEEEGQNADKVISITKFQNLIITVSIVVLYLVAVLKTATYPTFDEHTIYLIGISHAGYIGGKVPDKP